MSKDLYVALPPASGGHSRWNDFLEQLQISPGFRGSKLLRLEYPASSLSRHESMRVLARSAAAAIDQEWVKARGYYRVVLIGHSLGALIARQAYLFASGVEPTFAPKLDWASSVSRIVLLAGLNRGLNWEYGPRWIRVLSAVAPLVPTTTAALFRDCLRGSAFMTNLRIEWIRHFERLGPDGPIVVQLLGDKDSLIHAEDSRDVEQSEKAYQRVVPGATHLDIANLSASSDPEGRLSLLESCVMGPLPTEASVRPVGPQRIVFLTHGIRAFSYSWPGRAKKLILERDPHADVVIPSKGWFSALRFVFPISRRRHLRLFRDSYSQRIALNPSAECLYIGHSNGTYLLGHNLRVVPGMTFTRAVVAASVLPTNFPWDSLVGRQVGALRTDHAAQDVPVGILCSLLRALGMEDVGPSGFRGFDQNPPGMTSVAFHRGGHSRMLEPDSLPNLVDFILPSVNTSRVETAVGAPLVEAPSKAIQLVMKSSRLIALSLLFVGILGIGWFVLGADVLTLQLRVIITLASLVLAAFLLDLA